MSLYPYLGKTSKTRETSLADLFPDDVLKKISDFLNMYEAIGLGMVSKHFRDFMPSYLLSRFHYEPWAARDWKAMGMVTPQQSIATKRTTELTEIARSTFVYLTSGIQKELGLAPDPGVHCEWVAKIAKESKTKNGTVYGLNCLAVLRWNGEKIWALNFTATVDLKTLGDTMKKLGYDDSSINYALVSHRHAEMRLLMKVARGFGAFELDIDKVCCVFCASQLITLGFKDVTAKGWNRGALNWYTFLPIIMYFTDKRQKYWGVDTEQAFQNMSRNERLLFLQLLVAQTRENTPEKRTFSISSPSNSLSIGNSNSNAYRTGTVGKCPKCGGRAVLKQSKFGSGTYWACPNFKNHKN